QASLISNTLIDIESEEKQTPTVFQWQFFAFLAVLCILFVGKIKN
ncbi:hypothetical protein EZS27_036323, partial [termite gut metagenome]